MHALPYTSIVHDRVAMNINGACTRRDAVSARPVDLQAVKGEVLETSLPLRRSPVLQYRLGRGFFYSLSTGDYSSLLPLIMTLTGCAPIPALRSRPFTAGRGCKQRGSERDKEREKDRLHHWPRGRNKETS